MTFANHNQKQFLFDMTSFLFFFPQIYYIPKFVFIAHLIDPLTSFLMLGMKLQEELN